MGTAWISHLQQRTRPAAGRPLSVVRSLCWLLVLAPIMGVASGLGCLLLLVGAGRAPKGAAGRDVPLQRAP